MGMFDALSGFVAGKVSGFLPNSGTKASGTATKMILEPSKLAGKIDPIEQAVRGDPLSFGSINYPSDLGSEGLGHYIIFYMLSNNYGHVGRDFDMAKSMGWNASYTSKDVGFDVGSKGDSLHGEGVGPSHETRSIHSGRIDDIRHGRTTTPTLDNHSLTTTIPKHQVTTGAVSLYMPPGITATYKNNYETEAAELAGDIFKTGSEMVKAETRTKAMQAFLKGFTGAAGIKIKELGSGILDTLGGGDLFRLASKSVGLAVNPRQEQYYNGPAFRSFTYTFDFYPKSKEEAEDVQKIVKLFKYHSSPAMETSGTLGRFFIVPSEFEIHYMFKEGPNPHLHQIARCVCENVEVKYGPDAQWSTFKDGQPTSTQMTLTFTELEFITKEKILPSIAEGPTKSGLPMSAGM